MSNPLLVEAVDGFANHPHSHTGLLLSHLALAFSSKLTVKCASFEVLQEQVNVVFIVKNTE